MFKRNTVTMREKQKFKMELSFEEKELIELSTITGVCARPLRQNNGYAKRRMTTTALLPGRALKGIIMEVAAKQAEKITDMKARMSDIYLAVSWREIARTYFDKSVPWFQHKMYGIDGNGGVGGFTEQEAGQLKGALLDLSDRIRRAAENIPAPATV